jgi:CDP-diacylglycerol--serine O-phosphatidyltransferase
MFNIFKRADKRKIIGFYRPCDIVTLMGTTFGLMAIIFAIQGKITGAVLCLVMSGICDAFDGVLARMWKYDDMEKTYGRELDSISDVIAFGVAPAVITLCSIGFSHISTTIISIFFVLAGVVRLSYFNTLEISGKDIKNYFKGVPITAIAILYPIVYFVSLLFDFAYYDITITILMFVVGVSYVTPIKIRKIGNNIRYVLAGLGLVLVIYNLIKIIF